jgi:serine/threonine protein phosphatase 1
MTLALHASGHRNQIMKLSRVTRCLTLQPNAHGRDLIVGDLHGHRALLEQELERIGFDPRRDRVLSVGDLVDRGPDSLGTLSLIEEPWFHAVLGNHELMLLNFLGHYGSRIHARKSFRMGGGAWVGDALHRHGRRLARLAERMAELPLALHVRGDVPFNVAHSDLRPLGSCQEGLFKGETICVHKADVCTSSRHHVHEAMRHAHSELHFAQHAVRVSAAPLGTLPITYVGHSPLRQVTVHDSYVYVDQRVCAPTRRAEPQPPTVLDHRKFAFWLRGVVTAHGRGAGNVRSFPLRPGLRPFGLTKAA